MSRPCPECGGGGLHFIALGHGNVGEEPCTYCSETGKDPYSCEKCDADGEVYNEDGEFLCGDCWFEWHIEHEVNEFFDRDDKEFLTDDD